MTQPTEHRLIEEGDIETSLEDRRWLLLALLLLLLVFCCLFSSSQLALILGIGDSIEAKVIDTDSAPTSELDVQSNVPALPPLNLTIVAEQATQHALAAENTPDIALPTLVGFVRQTPTPTPINPTITNTPRPTFTAGPAQVVATPTATNTPTGTLQPTPTPTQTPTGTLTPTATDTPSPTSTQTPTGTLTPTATGTPSPTLTSTPTGTQTSTSTRTPTPTSTSTGTQTPTNTSTPTSTSTGTPTLTLTSTPTGTLIPTNTSTPTRTPTATSTSSATAIGATTNTPTYTPSSSIVTATPTPTNSPTLVSPTGTPTNTPTPVTPPTNTPTPVTPPTNTPTPVTPPTNTPTPVTPPTNTPTPVTPPTNTPTPVTPPTNTPTPVTPPTNTPTPVTPPTNTPTPSPTATQPPVIASLILEPSRSTNVDRGKNVEFPHILTNTGSDQDTFTITSSSSRGYTVTPEIQSITLKQGETKPVSIIVSIPASAEFGDQDQTIVTARSSNDTTVSASVIDTAIIKPQISIDIEANERRSVLPGELVNFKHIVTNTGDIPDIISISASDIEPGLPATISPSQTNLLGPSESQTITVSYMVPNTITNGARFDVTVSAQSNNDTNVTDAVLDTVTLLNTETVLNAAAGDSQVSLGWDTLSVADSYDIEFSVNGGLWTTLANETTDRFYHNENVNNDLTYAYQLRINNDSGGIIGYSNIVTNITPSLITRITETCDIGTSFVTIGYNLEPTPNENCEFVLKDIDGSPNPVSDFGLIRVFPQSPTAGSVIQIEYLNSINEGIIDGDSYDFVYYGGPVITSTSGVETKGIEMYFVEIQLSEDGLDWTTVFAWDGQDGGVSNSSIASFGVNGLDEMEKEFIAEANLEPDPSPSLEPGFNTGIAIDIQPILKAGTHYRYIRFIAPPNSELTNSSSLDAIYRLN